MQKGFLKFSLIFGLFLILMSLSTAFNYASGYKVSAYNELSAYNKLQLTQKMTAFLYLPESRKNAKIFINRKSIQQASASGAGQTDTNASVASSTNQAQGQASSKQPSLKGDYKFFPQFAPPAKGDEIAVIKTNAGSIKIKLLSAYAPKTVALFKERVNNGFYNGTVFFKVVPNSIIQGGQQTQGSPINTEALDEFNPEVRNFRGAVSLVYSDTNAPQDQFLIVQADSSNIVNDSLNYMTGATQLYKGEPQFPQYVINEYKRFGGAPWLDFHNVVFGQVIKGKQGLDTVDQISQQDVDESNKPKKEIKIIKINITTN